MVQSADFTNNYKFTIDNYKKYLEKIENNYNVTYLKRGNTILWIYINDVNNTLVVDPQYKFKYSDFERSLLNLATKNENYTSIKFKLIHPPRIIEFPDFPVFLKWPVEICIGNYC